MGTNTGLGIGIGIPFKNNALGGDKPYFPPELKARMIGVWTSYGKKNTDADRNIIKNKIPNAGGDLEILNAAYKLNSGFGKYSEDFTTWTKSSKITSVDSESFDFITNVNWNLLYYKSNIGKDIPSFKVHIKLKGEGKVFYNYITSEGVFTNKVITSEEYVVPISYNTKYTGETPVNCGFSIGITSEECSGTITQIPNFEDAFVTDGINDMIISQKTLQEMGVTKELTIVSMIHQISWRGSASVPLTNYIRPKTNEYVRSHVSNIGKTGIYGYVCYNISNSGAGNSHVVNTILGDKNDYSINIVGDLSQGKFSVQGYIDDNGNILETSSVAHYWTFAVLGKATEDEINLIIGNYNLDRSLKPDILCNIGKQGITNDNHAEFNDKLIDYSGNGRDIQMNNLAWKGDSGIGKYEVDFLDSSIWSSSNSTITSSKIDCKNAISHIMLLYYSVGGKEYPDIPSFKVIKTGADIDYSYIDETGSPKSVKIVDGVNVLPASHNTLYSGSGRFCGFGNPGMGNSVTITQIPSHAGGLCLDGVNDFGKVTGMPIYKDYTVVTDREIFANIGAILSKNNPGAFVETAGNSVYSFGQATSGLNFISTRSISYLSKYSYCGQSITAGAAEDGTDMWLGTIRDNDSRFFNGAIYSLMSFPYSMSEFLIERQLKKHKLGTLYPDMVEFRPIIKANANYKITYYQIDSTNTWKSIKVGDYIVIGAKLAFQITFDNDASELKEVVSPQLSGIIVEKRPSNPGYNIYSYITSKSPQKINITIDEYIRFEDIVQPYPVLLRFKDENGNEVSWGGKFKVGSTITRIGSIDDTESNLLNGLYSISGLSLNGKAVTSSTSIVEKQMVFRTTATWLLDNNEPKVILSPSRLRIPNSSYKLLGYIPDISGHGNNGVIHNSAYAEGSGVNEDGSYQFDGVDDFVTIPTTVGGKQVLMKVNWQSYAGGVTLYDQRLNLPDYEFAIYNGDRDLDDNPIPAYQGRNNGQTYIDGILNNNIKASELRHITHNITITNELSLGTNNTYPVIGSTRSNTHFAQMALYDFMLFDDISTDDKIKELNEYVGIEAKVELPPYYWDAYGKTNLDADKATIQQRGVAVGDYDLTNYNHAYNKMSGYGGYKFAKFDNTIEWFAEDSSMVVNRNGYLITLKKVPNVAFWRFRNTTLKSLDNPLTFKVKCNKPIDVIFQVKFAKNNDVSIGYNYNIKEVTLVPNESTTIIVPSVSVSDIPEATSILFINVLFDNTSLSDNEEYTVEMLPLYPNGLSI